MTAAGSPLVSVVITTYNRPDYLTRAVKTVCAQSYEPIEVIVVDDHSSIPAREVLANISLAVESFEIRRHAENRGVNAARNTGLKAATGEYIAFLDDDDRWSPDKIEKQVRRFREADDSVGVVYTGRKLVDDNGVRTVTIPEGIDGDPTKQLLCRNVVGTQSAVMVRADVAKETPFDERIPRWADLEWYVAVSTKCNFEAVQEPLVIYEFAAHNRISDNYEELETAHRIFTDKYRGLAAEYGRLFERKMLGYASFRAGSASLGNRDYSIARRYFLRALRWYPLEPMFYLFAVATLGGRFTHRTARRTKQLVSALPFT